MSTLYKLVVAFSVVFCMVVPSTYAVVRHVAKTGSNSNPGTFEQPWATLSYAGANAVAGDTIYIHAGTYFDRLAVRNSGTPGNPIVFTNYNNDVVTIDGTGIEAYSEMNISSGGRTWFGIVDMYNVSWIEIRGLRIMNATKCNGIFGQDAHHLIIENNYIENCFNSGIGFLIRGVQYTTDGSAQVEPQDTTKWKLSTNVYIRNNEITKCNNKGWSEVVSLEGVDTFEVSDNLIHNNLNGLGGWGGGGENIDAKRSSRNGKIFNNIVRDSPRVGIYIDAWDGHCYNIEIFNNHVFRTHIAGITIGNENNGKVSNIKVYNNNVYNNINGILLNKYANAVQTVTDIYIYNNTVVNNGYREIHGGLGIYILNDQINNVVVANNVLTGNQIDQIFIAQAIASDKYTVDNNLVYPFKNYPGGGIKGNNAIEADPYFVNPDVFNFMLTDSSPAIDKAVGIHTPAFDIDNKPRPFGSGSDLGAFEYDGSPLPSVPIAPSGLTAQYVPENQIDITWTDNSDDEVGFRIERKIGTDTFKELAILDANVTSFSNSGLKPGTSYTYRVRAFNLGGNSSYSNEVVIVTPGPASPPLKPDRFTAQTLSYHEIKLEWRDKSDNEEGFKIERSSGNGSFLEVINLPANSITYTDKNLDPQTTYSYRIMAFSSGGNSSYSNTATAITLVLPPLTVYEAEQYSSTDADLQSTHQGFTGTGYMDYGNYIEWNNINPGGAGTYDLKFRYANGSLDNRSCAVILNGILVDTVLFAPTADWATWDFDYVMGIQMQQGNNTIRVQILSGFQGPNLDNFSIVGVPDGGVAPAAPSNLIIDNISSSQVKLNWTDNSNNEIGFKIEVTDSEGDFIEIFSVAVNTNFYICADLIPGTEYTFRVRAYNAVGDSDYTNEVTISTLTSVDALFSSCKIEVFPNPASTHVNINSNEQMEMHVISITGNLLQTIQINAGMNTLETDQLVKGIYILRFINKNDESFISLIVK